ncbi:MAG: hypothetical protein U9Q30_03345 [Campylobacterota bacterium]|nr:hypothetical protein [Campylobacterota bacterium]
MKKSIALLITLFFIASISIFILKNLNDSNSFMDEVSFDTALTQFKITNNDIQTEVMGLIAKYKDDNETLGEILEITSMGVPFEYGNLSIFITLDYAPILPDCYLSNLKGDNALDTLYNRCDEDLLKNILYPYDFIDIFKGQDIKTQKQLDYLIDEYIISSKDDKMDSVRTQFGYINTADLNITEDKFRCEYELTIANINTKCYFDFNATAKEIETFKLNIF